MQQSDLPLRDLHLPDAIGWWPLAPGWWLVIALLTAGLVWLLRSAWRAHRHSAPRRQAIGELASIEADYLLHRDPVVLGKQLSTLLRRSMLAYAPRAEIAGLTGSAWLAWLDRDLPLPYFHTQGGRSLLQLPYRDPLDDLVAVDINALFAAVRIRLQTPVGSVS